MKISEAEYKDIFANILYLDINQLDVRRLNIHQNSNILSLFFIDLLEQIVTNTKKLKIWSM